MSQISFAFNFHNVNMTDYIFDISYIDWSSDYRFKLLYRSFLAICAVYY